MVEREIYVTDGKYKICPIIDEDRRNYVETRRQQDSETLFLNPVAKDIMWSSVLEDRDKTYVILNEKGEYCGYIELQNPSDEHPELGIVILEKYRNKGIASVAIKNFAKRYYEENRNEYFLIRISSDNLHSIHVFEKLGARYMRSEDNGYEKLMEGIRQKMGDEDISVLEEFAKKQFGVASGEQEVVVRYYKYEPGVFLN